MILPTIVAAAFAGFVAITASWLHIEDVRFGPLFAIYALLYRESHGRLPTSLGIFFLKHGEQLMDVNDELLRQADLEIRWVHERTRTDDLHAPASSGRW